MEGTGVPEISDALSPDDLEAVRDLFVEYQRAIGVSLCFQGFESELASLPGDYARPRGRLLLIAVEGRTAGCVALRALSDEEGEMKRLYVRPEFRGRGLGRLLARRIVRDARALGYRRLKLDTLPSMNEAQALYEQLGFRDCAPYNVNPVEGVRFMALELGQVR